MQTTEHKHCAGKFSALGTLPSLSLVFCMATVQGNGLPLAIGTRRRFLLR